jgi:hypothetical protein
MNVRTLRNRLALIPAAALAAAGPAMAAVPEEVTTALNAAKTDGLAVAGLLLAVAVGIWGALFIKRKFFG